MSSFLIWLALYIPQNERITSQTYVKFLSLERYMKVK